MLEPTTNRRDELLRAAERLFSRRGYHATTMRELGRELQIEGGSLYNHISSKSDLLYEIVLRGSHQFLTAATSVLDGGGTARERLRELMRRHMAIVAESSDRAAVYFHEWRHLDPERQATIIGHRDEYEHAFRQIIRAGIANGEFVLIDEQLASIHVLSLLNWAYQWYRPTGSLSAIELAERFFEQVMRGMEC